VDLTRTLEKAALSAWPAEQNLRVGTWLLRYTRGVTRRANSVWVNGGSDLPPLVDEVERFYRRRGLPPLIQIGPLAPPQLDPFLASRGYAIDAPVAIQVADLQAIPAADGARVEATLTDTWFAAASTGRFAAAPSVYRGILERIGPRALFASAGGGAAVGLGVLDGEWLGVFNMATAKPLRRRGLARAVLSALADAARARGARRVYLQVERDNAPALALYAKAGFTEAYGYHYRVLPK
jgi:GNAT superfamily N-acetyltransferase